MEDEFPVPRALDLKDLRKQFLEWGIKNDARDLAMESMETFIPQYGLEMIREICENYTDADELEKLDESPNTPFVGNTSETRTGRRRGLGKKTIEKMGQETKPKKSLNAVSIK